MRNLPGVLASFVVTRTPYNNQLNQIASSIRGVLTLTSYGLHYFNFTNQVLFWSGVYTLAHRYAEAGRNYVTLEDTLIGYLMNSLVWCGQSEEPGINYSHCPQWTACPREASESFWAAASEQVCTAIKYFLVTAQMSVRGM